MIFNFKNRRAHREHFLQTFLLNMDPLTEAFVYRYETFKFKMLSSVRHLLEQRCLFSQYATPLMINMETDMV